MSEQESTDRIAKGDVTAENNCNKVGWVKCHVYHGRNILISDGGLTIHPGWM
jgi:hypothetical protein